VKKSLVLISFLAIGASLFAQDCRRIPGRLTDGFGTVTFVSDREWRVEGNGMVQIWSDAVQADSCSNVEEFVGSGANRGGFRFALVNCRSNPEQSGDLFTWCAATSFASQLCPEPWRVPTAVDFCNLDRILMGSDLCYSHTTTPERLRDTYIDVWGGTLSGGTSSRGQLFWGGEKAYYWSATEYDGFYAFYLTYDLHGTIKSQCIENTKALGFSVRCVRDAE
jgi:uncharacterized protein (TIGR02145 family)